MPRGRQRRVRLRGRAPWAAGQGSASQGAEVPATAPPGGSRDTEMALHWQVATRRGRWLCC